VRRAKAAVTQAELAFALAAYFDCRIEELFTDDPDADGS